MRLWTLHPRYLDPKGLVALWREALLAQRVLAGGTRGYRNHPQLARFRACRDPLAAIGAYLDGVHAEAGARGYSFDPALILERGRRTRLRASSGQLRFERRHLRAKLQQRHPQSLARLRRAPLVPHPLFRVVPGGVAPWERASKAAHPS
jgi:hypothetical protein